jgi:IS1 family transposase
MRLPINRAISVLNLLLEGMSVRSVERITSIHRDTICRLLLLAGEHCQKLLREKIKGIEVQDVEVDEIWGYVFKKEGHKWDHELNNQTIGDAYCFIAMERNTKLVLTHYLGKRTAESTDQFISRLALATDATRRYQLTSDGFGPYKPAVKSFLRGRVDFAQLVKVYASPRESEQRYSPPEVVDAVPQKVMGNPDSDRICTSHIERQNLSIRMGMRRMTRLTNGFSKKWENLDAAYALWFAYYNFCRVHSTLKVTPAMESNVTDHVWKLEELVSIH